MAKYSSLNSNTELQSRLNDLSTKDKLRITRIVKPTLEKLNVISNQMKEWRIERAQLKDNVGRLKLALNSVEKRAETGSQTQLSIDQLKEQMRLLEMTNQTLEEEIKHLKSALIEAQVDVKRTNNSQLRNQMLRMKDSFSTEKRLWSGEITYLRKRLSQVEDTCKNSTTNRGKNMETVFRNVISEVAKVMADLLEELSEVGNHLDRSKIENENLCSELNHLKAIIGTKTDVGEVYGEKMDRLNVSMEELKLILENIPIETIQDSPNDNSLTMINNDYNRFLFTRKLIHLCKSVQCLNLKFKNEFDVKGIGESLQLFDVDICELRKMNPKNDDWITVGLNADEYSRKIETLVNIIQGSREAIEKLQAESITRYDKAKLENVESYIGKLCREVETLVEGISISTKNDEVSLVEGIRKLQGTILQSELESTTEKNSANYLQSELKSLKPLNEEVQVLRSKISQLTKEVLSAKGEAKEKGIRALTLLREHEDLKNLFDDTKRKFNDTTLNIQIYEKENQSLRMEVTKLGEIVRKTEKSKESLDNEIVDLKNQLKEKIEEFHAVEGNQHLRNKLNDLERSKVEEFDQLLTKQRQMEEKLLSLTIDNEALKQKYEETTCRKDEIELNFNRINSKSIELDEQLQRCQNERETLREKVERLNMIRLDSQIAQDQLTSDKTRLGENLQGMEHRLKLFESTNVQLKEELEELRLKNEYQNDTLSIKNEELIVAVRKAEIESNQLIFVRREYEELKKILGIPSNWTRNDLESINPQVLTNRKTDAEYGNEIIEAGIKGPIENSTGQTKAEELLGQNGGGSIQFKNDKPKMNLGSIGTKGVREIPDTIEFTKQNNLCDGESTDLTPVLNFQRKGIIGCVIETPNTSDESKYYERRMSSGPKYHDEEETTGNNKQLTMEYETEMKALKMEVWRLRGEKMDLLLRLDNTRMDSKASDMERKALKNELLGLRKKKSHLSIEIDNLKSDFERLKQINSGLDDKLTGVLKGVNKYTTAKDQPNGIESKLELILKDYTAMRKITTK